MEKYSITRCSNGSSKSRLAVSGGDRGCRADIGEFRGSIAHRALHWSYLRAHSWSLVAVWLRHGRRVTTVQLSIGAGHGRACCIMLERGMEQRGKCASDSGGLSLSAAALERCCAETKFSLLSSAAPARHAVCGMPPCVSIRGSSAIRS